MLTLTVTLIFTLLYTINAAQQPNIIFLMTDSMDGRNMDPTAPQYNTISMPYLRSISNKGVQFVNTYTSSPQCVPGRACLFSGRRTNEQKAFNNGMGWGMSSDGQTVDKACKGYYNEQTCKEFYNLQKINYTLLDAMTDIGYNVYLIGKVDVGANIIEQSSQANATANGFHNGPNTGSGIPIFTRSANIDKPTKGKPVANENDNNVHNEDWQIANNCIDKLNELGSNKNDNNKPFMLYCSINIPHPPYQTNATWLNGVDINSVTLPIWLNESDFHPADKYQSISKDVWGNFTNNDILNVRSTYYAMNNQADYILGTVINASIVNGFHINNTVFIYTSDHGDMNMEHRQQLKNSMYEGSSRVPLYFAGPGIKQGIIIKNMTNNIDILPTLIEIGGGKVPEFITGSSLYPWLLETNYDKNNKLINNISIQHPNYAESQYHSNMGNTGSFMIRKGKYKYIQFGHYLSTFKNYSAQLFDLENDPQELYDISNENINICNDMENILLSLYNYEYIDCIAKRHDFNLFEQYFWNAENQTAVYQSLQQGYQGFDENDWNKIIQWRNEMLNGPQCTPNMTRYS